MCEYCGCQAIAAIELLTREHDVALDHIRRATQAIAVRDLRVLRSACAELAAVLAPHTAVEEEALFPALRADFPDQIDVLTTEHRAFERALEQILGCSRVDDGSLDRLRTALDLLRDHIRKEQDGVFPAALSTLTPDQWDQLDTVRQGFRSTLPVQM